MRRISEKMAYNILKEIIGIRYEIVIYMKIERYTGTLHICSKMNSRDILIKLFKTILFELCSYLTSNTFTLASLLLIFSILNSFIFA